MAVGIYFVVTGGVAGSEVAGGVVFALDFVFGGVDFGLGGVVVEEGVWGYLYFGGFRQDGLDILIRYNRFQF